MYTIILFAIIGGVIGTFDERRRVKTTTCLGTGIRVQGHYLEMAILCTAFGAGLGSLTAFIGGAQLPDSTVLTFGFGQPGLSLLAQQSPRFKKITLVVDEGVTGDMVALSSSTSKVVPPILANWVIVPPTTESLELRLPKP